jgi:hypothetical protein
MTGGKGLLWSEGRRKNTPLNGTTHFRKDGEIPSFRLGYNVRIFHGSSIAALRGSSQMGMGLAKIVPVVRWCDPVQISGKGR